ncbi:MAG: hypothetical protein ABIJ59_15335 [Pseudomonadota bacterium]
MKKNVKLILSILMVSVFLTMAAIASDMKGHDMPKSDKIGDLIHESVIDGYTLSYYFMDLRNQNAKGHTTGSHNAKDMEMDKPHHLMLYIEDANHKPVLKGKVGFVIKDASGKDQKAMAMFMSNGFGTTANMKQKGMYTIVAKAIVGDKKLMDSFDYEIK